MRFVLLLQNVQVLYNNRELEYAKIRFFLNRYCTFWHHFYFLVDQLLFMKHLMKKLQLFLQLHQELIYRLSSQHLNMWLSTFSFSLLHDTSKLIYLKTHQFFRDHQQYLTWVPLLDMVQMDHLHLQPNKYLVQHWDHGKLHKIKLPNHMSQNKFQFLRDFKNNLSIILLFIQPNKKDHS